MYVPKGNPRALEAVYNMMGMITQKNGFPLFGAQIVFDEPRDWKGEIIVVGRTADLPGDLMASAPLKVMSEGKVPYPVVRSWDTELTVAFSQQVSEFGAGVGALMQFESPYRIGRSVVLLTASGEADLAEMGKAVLDPAVQGAINGDLVLIGLTAPDYKTTALRVGDRYTTGDRGEITRVEAYLYSHPRVFRALMYGSVVALALVAFIGLRNYRRRRLLRTRQTSSQPGNPPVNG